LHLANDPPLPGQWQEPQPPVSIEEDGEYGQYEVEEIVDSRADKRKRDPITKKMGSHMYKIKYSGYPIWNENPPWQPFTDAASCPQLVADFHHHYKDKPGPHESFQTPED